MEQLESDVFLGVLLSVIQPRRDVRHFLAIQARWMSLLEVSPPTSKSRRKSRRTYWRLQLLLNHCSLPPKQPAKCVTLKLRTQAASLDLNSLSPQHHATTRVKIAVDCRHFSVVVLYYRITLRRVSRWELQTYLVYLNLKSLRPTHSLLSRRSAFFLPGTSIVQQITPFIVESLWNRSPSSIWQSSL